MPNTACPSKTALATTALCGVLALLAAPAVAQDRSFDIPAGDLRQALSAYEAATGQRVRVEGVDLAGRTTSGVRGAGSAEAALDSLLAGTRLTACDEAAGVVIISAGQACPARQDGRETDNATRIDDVVVTATGVSHLADRNRTGTRMDADPLTVPLSVSTVSEELIQRQQAITLADAAGNVVGVTSDREGSFQMRGFGAQLMRNGNLGVTGTSNNLPIVAISRLEVVKGPEAIIAGLAAGYGGVVNVITKTPPNSPTAEVMSTLGSRGYYDVGFDVGGPLNSDRTILARLVGSTQDADENAAGYDGASMDYLAPSVTFRIPRWGTELTAQYEYQDLREAPDLTVFGRPGETSLADDLPVRRFGPTDTGRNVESRILNLALEQAIGEDWSLAVRYSRDETDRFSNIGSTFRLEFLVPYPEIPTIVFENTQHTTTENLRLEARGEFNTGPIAHNLLLAYDQSEAEHLISIRPTGVFSTNFETGEVRDRIADLGPIFGVPGPGGSGGIMPEETGLLLMDQMTWGKWVVLAGVRRIEYDTQALNGPDLEPYKETLPSLGVVYRLTPTISVYGNASKGFMANQGLFTISGDPVPPESAQQYELGAKALLFGERVAASMAVYKIEQENVAAPDPDNPFPIGICQGASQVCYVSVPGVRSQGVELEVSGKVLSRLEVRANYTYTDKEVDPLFQANTLYLPHQGSLWATYSFNTDGMGWWVGGGLQARSARSDTGRPEDLDNPGQIRVDLSAGYEADRWSAIVGIKNVADERLYSDYSGVFGTGVVEQPREIFATLRYRFR